MFLSDICSGGGLKLTSVKGVQSKFRPDSATEVHFRKGVQCIAVVVQFGPATDYTKRSALHAIVVKLGPATDVHCSERK